MNNQIIHGDATTVLQQLEAKSIDMCFTSPNPPFYHDSNKGSKYEPLVIGTDNNIHDYVIRLLVIFKEIHRVLKDTGSLFVNMGDYYDAKIGRLMNVPELFMLNMNALWFLRSKLIWHRTETDTIQTETNRFKRDWEYNIFFTKSKDGYYFNNKGNKYWKRSVFSYPHAYTYREFSSGFPIELVNIAIHTTVPEKNGIILDPMAGTGTVGLAAKKLNRNYIMIDIDKEKCDMMQIRLRNNT